MKLHQTTAPSIKPLAVSEIIKSSKTILEQYFSYIEIFGEVGNVTYQQNSGHIYFNLKDQFSEIKCTLFKFYASKVNFTIKKGDMLLVTGKITLYEARGEYQIQVQQVRYYEGVGLLHHNLERLKEELRLKGYFDPIHKKSLPYFVHKIALITSATGAVVHDMKTVAQKRWRNLELFLIPTLVQGEFAAEHIANHIRFADNLNMDVIIIGRGGGSLEDLWAFNDQSVADAIFMAKTPIVSAVGHDTDTPISDFVADVRAPTPSAAMEIILPDQNEWLLRLDAYSDQFAQKASRILEQKRQKLQNLQALLSLTISSMSFTLQKNKLAYFQKFLEDQCKQHIQSQSQKLVLLQNQNNLYIQKHFTKHQKRIEFLKHQLNAITLSADLQRKASKITFLHQLLSQGIIQTFKNKRQVLEQSHAQMEALNPQILQKKGFVQIWHQNSIGEIKNIAQGEIFEISDCSFKATVQLISKLPIQG